MIVVSDSSPLVTLSAVGELRLLRSLFGRVLVPEAVYEEVTVRGAGRPGADEVAAAPWIERHGVGNETLARVLEMELDVGEAAAIALALERGADVVLLDEQRGRRRAKALGLAVTGTVGVLVRAKERSLLAEVRPFLDAIRDKAGFWISDALYAHVLEMSDERA